MLLTTCSNYSAIEPAQCLLEAFRQHLSTDSHFAPRDLEIPVRRSFTPTGSWSALFFCLHVERAAMPRRARCVLPGVPYHVTQRGADRQATFSLDEDRHTYLRLLRENLSDADVPVWAWCLMSNHVHLVLLPGREDSLSLLLRRVHGRYAQYYNTRWGRTGHSCQNRFFSCILGIEHLWAITYVASPSGRMTLVCSAVSC